MVTRKFNPLRNGQREPVRLVLGAIIREERLRRGWKQSKLAEISGVRRQKHRRHRKRRHPSPRGVQSTPCPRLRNSRQRIGGAGGAERGPLAGDTLPNISTFPFDLVFVSLQTFRADAVGEHGFGMRRDVSLDLPPVALIVADALARGADRQQSGKQLDMA